MRVNKNSLSQIILEILEKTVDSSVRFMDFAENPHFYAYNGRWQQNLPKSALSKAIARLAKKGLVEKVFVNKHLLIKLTKTGKSFLPEQNIKWKWNGKYILVVFDIPEQRRRIRNLFRRFLKKLEFNQLQKSVWISKKPIFDTLVSTVKDLKIESWVTLLETDKIEPPPKI